MKADCKKQIMDSLYPYYHDLKHYFLAFTKNEMDAEDMTQDLFLKLLSSDEIYIIGASARNLVFTIAKRMIIDEIRHRMFVIRAIKGYTDEQREQCHYNQYNELVCRQIEDIEHEHVLHLPEKMQQAYTLARYNEMEVIEISKSQNLNKRTVESNLYLSRKRMREYMRQAINM